MLEIVKVTNGLLAQWHFIPCLPCHGFDPTPLSSQKNKNNNNNNNNKPSHHI